MPSRAHRKAPQSTWYSVANCSTLRAARAMVNANALPMQQMCMCVGDSSRWHYRVLPTGQSPDHQLHHPRYSIACHTSCAIESNEIMKFRRKSNFFAAADKMLQADFLSRVPAHTPVQQAQALMRSLCHVTTSLKHSESMYNALLTLDPACPVHAATP